MGEYESLVELFKRISEISPGPSPNEGFGVEPTQMRGPGNSNWPISTEEQGGGRLGVGNFSTGDMGSHLNELQRAGVRPPMPGQQGGLGQKTALFELLRLLTEAGAMQQQGVQAPAAPEPQQTGTVGGSRNLLQELLGGMHE